jgi:hypothetical protein
MSQNICSKRTNFYFITSKASKLLGQNRAIFMKIFRFCKSSYFLYGCHCSFLRRVPIKLVTLLRKQDAIFYMFKFYPHTTVQRELTRHTVLLVLDDGV